MNQSAKTRDILKRIVPWALEQNAHKSKFRSNYKGNRGRIGIVGGARDYSGAPYFASISAMRLGADLAYVICSSTAAQSIKNYSPDLIVSPLLDCSNEQEFNQDIECLLKRLHALVIGPGLGRDRLLLDRAKSLIVKAKDRSMPLIFDADSLLLINEDPSIIKSYPKAILTPNRVELQRLLNSLYRKGCNENEGYDLREMEEKDIAILVKRCSMDLNVTILAKGMIDIINDGTGQEFLTEQDTGSNRRCGGQGDITAGLAAVYSHWLEEANKITGAQVGAQIDGPLYSWAAYLAAITTRTCNELAYNEFRNGMLASDMIKHIPLALDRLLDHSMNDNDGERPSQCSSAIPALASSQRYESTLKNIHYKGILSMNEISRYARQMIMDEFGPERQLKLKASSVLIIGAGGLGCPASIYLAGAGIGRIGIVDDDWVEESNLHRQILHNVAKIGSLKTESIKQSLLDLNPYVHVDTHSIRLNRINAVKIVEGYDMVIDATDNLMTRYMINDACVVAKKALISGAALKMSGQLTVYNYDKDTPCFRCLFPEPPPPNAVGSCSENGVMGVLPGIIGVQQALEAVKIGAGMKPAYAGKMLIYDGELGLYRHITLSSRRNECEACGENSQLTRELIDYEQFCGTVTSNCKVERGTTTQSSQLLQSNERISVQEYSEILASGKAHVLVDVRPLAHSDVSRLANAIQLPLAKLFHEPEVSWSIIKKELDDKKTRDIYVVCRRGIASQRGTRLIQDMVEHFNNNVSNEVKAIPLGDVIVRDIVGGMTVWAEQVDSNYRCV